MIAGWMLYTAVVTGLLAVAAWTVERPLRVARRATRWVWVAAVVAALLLAVRAGAFPKVETVVAESVATTEGAAIGVVQRSIDAVAAPPSLPADLDPWLLGLWAGLSLGMALLFLRAVIRLGRVRSRWRPATLDGRTVLLSDSSGPATLGWGRAAIVVPRWALSMAPADRELLLRHEEEHLRAGDARLHLAGIGALVLMPWNPALWWMVARLGQAIEVDCDRRVLAGTADLHRYAHLLLDIGRRGAPLHAGALAFARPAPFLERRIRVMTDPTRPRALRATVFVAGAALLTFAACQVDRPSIVEPERAEAIQEQVPDGPFSVQLRIDGTTVTGSVLDAETGQPLEAARVTFPAMSMGALTNARGRFLMLNVPQGEHEIVIEHGSRTLSLPTIHVEDGPPAPPTAPPANVDDATRQEIRQIRELPPAPPGPDPTKGTFVGTVVLPDGTPVQAAQIAIPELGVRALTNIAGRFLILGVPPGTHTVQIALANDVLQEIEVEITAGETTTRDRIEIRRR